MNCSEISAVVVTKGDRDITRVLDSLWRFGEVLVADNSKSPLDNMVFSRYIRAITAKFPVVYFQDDDTIVDTYALCQQYQPNRVVCNMPERWHKAYTGTGISLVGFGAVMDRAIAHPSSWIERYSRAGLPHDDVFLRECDRVFTYVNRDRVVWTDVKIGQLEYSSAPDRMYVQARTAGDYNEIRRRLATL